MPAAARKLSHEEIWNPPPISVDRYLRDEQKRDVKHEYYTGRIEAMAGANEKHEIAAMNLAAVLHRHLRGKKCRVFKSDMKLKVITDDKTVFYYPDIMVTCSPKDKHELYKEHPTLIIEVASSDWKKDYYEKLAAFLPIPSLKEYVVVWPNPKKPSVTIFRPQTGLKPAEVHRKGSFTLQSVNLTMNVTDIYEA
ncbi:MAG: Uma2 family endonuclease [Verrucomicrobiaceae bacterium]|nr:Uma2 family endonuclease [Verrucomicrobiaceae bacterium]